jgi:hypothetical protein
VTTTPLATYKDLCIDAVDPVLLGTFYGRALGLDVEPLDDGDCVLRGPTPEHTIWMNRVPEAKTVKHRLHLDVHASSVADLEALGAEVLDAESFRWTIMADPEDGELCAFVRDEPPAYKLYEAVLDCTDHAAQSAWWHRLLGGIREVDEDQGFSWVRDVPGMPFESLTFVPVPEPKVVKNRLHLDVRTPDLDAVVAAGATVLRRPDEDIRWTVLADPEGNELCAFTT